MGYSFYINYRSAFLICVISRLQRLLFKLLDASAHLDRKEQEQNQSKREAVIPLLSETNENPSPLQERSLYPISPACTSALVHSATGKPHVCGKCFFESLI